MSSYINAALRRLVATRAAYLCEYCLIHEEDAFFGCEVDHITSEKHGGQTEANNLAYACAFCNRSKGSDVGSIVQRIGTFVRFFNPRIDLWAEHFALDGVTILSLSDIGEVTARILDFNNNERLLNGKCYEPLGGTRVSPPLHAWVDAPNFTRHRIAARVRFGINAKRRVWAARGALRRYIAAAFT